MHRPLAALLLLGHALLAGCSPAGGALSEASPDAPRSETPVVASDAGAPGEALTQDAAPPSVAPREVCSGPSITTTGVVYAPTHAKNTLDIYAPANGARCPLVVWIHGGGWQSGSKELETGARTAVLRLVDRGYALASIDYRLSDDATFPAQIHDVKAAIRFLRANATKLRLDPDRVVLWGTSAGGHLAALAGTSAGVSALEDLGQGNPGVSSRVQGVIDCYGPTVLPAMDAELATNGCRGNHSAPGSPEAKLLGCAEGLASCEGATAASPVTYVDPTDPPMLLGHGLADCTVPHQQTARLEAALTTAGVRVSARYLPGGTHRIESCPEGALVDDFLDDVLR